ncbi:hypothetical protein GE09DRAFT_1228180 [Coniochaeta sp. 2T2.1]|nr:hypothetical protein GE09DRAFT_1228180 [Coniochaeta sp. 2T2.1]
MAELIEFLESPYIRSAFDEFVHDYLEDSHTTYSCPDFNEVAESISAYKALGAASQHEADVDYVDVEDYTVDMIRRHLGFRSVADLMEFVDGPSVTTAFHELVEDYLRENQEIYSPDMRPDIDHITNTIGANRALVKHHLARFIVQAYDRLQVEDSAWEGVDDPEFTCVADLGPWQASPLRRTFNNQLRTGTDRGNLKLYVVLVYVIRRWLSLNT